MLAALVLLGMTVPSQAKPVDPATALKVAATFAQTMLHYTPSSVMDITGQTPFTEFYVIYIGTSSCDELAQGFVLVAGDDCVMPILGYSFDNGFGCVDMPANVRQWLESYETQIRHYKRIERQMAAQGVAASWLHSSAVQWARLAGGQGETAVGGMGFPDNGEPHFTGVAPLLTTTWDQSPYYNNLCPYNNIYNVRTVTGCTATATAQVMKYWNHPAQGYGSNSYDSYYDTLSANFGATSYAWTSMPSALTSNSTSAQINAVATLMFHIGVAVEMNYGTSVEGGSAAATLSRGDLGRPSAENALRAYFKYSPSLHGVNMEDYSATEWAQLLRNELNNSRPILYTGYDTSAGHAFVCDGYNDNGQFHFNWGWGGWCDGYYVIGQLNPASGGTGGNSSYTFNLGNSAIIGIQPNNSFSTTANTTVTVGSNIAAAGSATGGGTKSFGDTVTLRATANAGYRFVQWNDGYKYNPRGFIATGGSYSFTAQFAALGGDTLGYCSNNMLTSLGFGSGDGSTDVYWGIRLRASSLTAGHSLRYVQLFVPVAGVYELNVYVGSTSNLVHTQSYTMTASAEDSWQTLVLTTPVAVTGTQDIWITFRNNDVGFPAAMTYCSGNSDALLWGNSFGSLSSSWDYSFMIRGIFGAEPPAPPMNDTISYCADAAYATSWRMDDNSTWGISFAPSELVGRNYLSRVLLFTTNNSTNYQLYVYQGTALAPDTLIHSQMYVLDGSFGWQSLQLNAVVAIDPTRYLWVVFNSPTSTGYPIASCTYSNNANSDWFLYNGTWTSFHTLGSDYQYSWLIKCVTSATAPNPMPTMTISGPTLFNDYTQQTFSASTTATGTISWTLPNATPATATGTMATAMWNNPGYRIITASVPSSQGTVTGAMTVGVQHYNAPTNDTVSYCHHLPAWGDWGYETGTTWYGIALKPGDLAGRQTLRAVQYYPKSSGIYTLHIYTGTATAPVTEVYSETYYEGSSYQWRTITLDQSLAINAQSYLWVIFETSASAYPGMVCDYAVDPMSNWISSNGTEWYHIGNANETHSWMIRCITSSAPPTYTITATSANSAQGTVSGSGTYTSGSTATLTATPASGYHFDHWQDGNTQNPRTITVTGDATYTAYFEANPPAVYTITATSAVSGQGTVSGGGNYVEGSIVTLTATPVTGYHFDHWQDGNTQNPRTITVTGDATYTAYFEANVGVDDIAAAAATIYPNPTASSAILSLSGVEGKVTVEMVDLTGRTVLQQEAEAQGELTMTLDLTSLPKGSYLVRITTANGHSETIDTLVIIK